MSNNINGDRMENVEILNYIYKNADMGYTSTLNLLTTLKEKENKIKYSLELIKDEYKEFKEKSKLLMKKQKFIFKKSSFVSKFSSSIGIKSEVSKDNSDSAIAHLMIQGLTMGMVDIESKIKRFENVCDNKIISFAKDYLSFQNKSLEHLKNYL